VDRSRYRPPGPATRSQTTCRALARCGHRADIARAHPLTNNGQAYTGRRRHRPATAPRAHEITGLPNDHSLTRRTYFAEITSIPLTRTLPGLLRLAERMICMPPVTPLSRPGHRAESAR